MADLVQQARIKRNKAEVPIYEKFILTIEEASQYFNIGRDKLYELAKEDTSKECSKFVLYNGRNILIKRKSFERFIDQKTYI